MCTIGRAQVALLPNVSDCAFSPGPGAAGPDGCAGGELTLLLAASRCDFTVVMAQARHNIYIYIYIYIYI